MLLIFEIVRSAGWLVGTILHAVLLLVMLEGRRERRTPGAYPWLVGSALLWHLGNLLAVFVEQLTAGGLPQLDMIARIVATVGLGFLPSALIHSAVAAKIERFSKPRLATVLGYLPSVVIAPAVYYQVVLTRAEFLKGLRETPWVVALLGVWFVGSLVFVGRTMYLPGKAPSDDITARFNRAFGIGLFGLALLTGVVAGLEILTGGEQEIVGETLLLFVMVLSLLPGGLLVYYVYRFRYMDLTIRRSLSVIAVVVAVWLAHSLVIRNITNRLEDVFGVNFALMEGALVAGVVVLFEPARRRLQAAIDAAMASARGRRRAELAAAQVKVAAAPPGDLRPVASRTQVALSKIFAAPAVVVLRAPSDDQEGDSDGVADGSLACAPEAARRHAGPILAWAAWAAEGPARRGELPETAGRAAENLGLADLVPIRTDTGPNRKGAAGKSTQIAGAAGFIGLAPRPKRGVLGQEDADSLTALAQTLAAAARDAHVVKRLVALEHKLAEAEKLSSLGRLSATIAHEVKNPLSSIKTIVGVLRESVSAGDATPAQFQGDLDVIASEVDRLSIVVTNLLNVARPTKKPGEGTAVVPPPEGFDTGEMLGGILAVLGPDAKRRGIELQTEFATDTPRVDARESGVRQAIFQLVLNAIEVTPEGGTVTLHTGVGTCRPPKKGGDTVPGVEIIIEDTGPGIPEDGEESIF